MSVYYHYGSQHFSRSAGHIPALWENSYEWEEANCWNCGGEFVLERENPDAGFQYKPCWTCGGVGVLSTTVEKHPDGYKLIGDFPELNIFGLYGQCNVWNPF